MFTKTATFICLLCLTGLTQPALAQQANPNASGGPSLDQRLDRLERLLKSQGLLDLLQQMQQLQDEVSQLRGQIEVQNHRLEQLQQRQRNLYADIDQRIQRLASNPGAAQGSSTGSQTGGPPLSTLSPMPPNSNAGTPGNNSLGIQTSTAGSEPAPASSNGAATPGQPAASADTSDIQPATVGQSSQVSLVQLQAEYQEAFRLLKEARYDQAISSFEQFLSSYSGREYADNAQYWLAEAHYVTRNFEPALAEYRKLVENYPDSQKLTHAMLKIGFTLQELGQMEAAKQQLQELIQQHPGTSAARLADERLQSITASETGTESEQRAEPLPSPS